MARELQNINESGELTEIKLNATAEANKLLEKQDIDAALAGKEDDLGNPAADGDSVVSTTGGTRSWDRRVEEAPDDGQEYVRKGDAWVVNSGGAGVSEAPEDGTPYSRQDAGWVGSPSKASEIANDSLVAGATVRDALETQAGEIGGNTTVILGHVLDLANPHAVTAAQVGGVEEAPNNSNPYSREGEAWIIAADALDVAHNATDIAGNTTNLSAHILDAANPHGVTASQVNAAEISGEDEVPGGMLFARVAALPGTPDPNTIYFITT